MFGLQGTFTGICLYLHSTELTGIIYSRGLGNGVSTRLSAQDLIDNLRTSTEERTLGGRVIWPICLTWLGICAMLGYAKRLCILFEGIRNLTPQIPPMALRYDVYKYFTFTRRAGHPEPDLLGHIQRHPVIGLFHVSPAFTDLQPGAYIGRAGDWACMSHVAGYLRHVGICEEALYSFEGIRNLSPQIPLMVYNSHSLRGLDTLSLICWVTYTDIPSSVYFMLHLHLPISKQG
ncbi:hypothetical protein OROGR_028782 [Orobanche gracilis]